MKQINGQGGVLTLISNSSLVYSVIMLVCLFSLIRYTKRNVMTPILKITHTMQQLAEGDLNAELELQEDTTEIGRTVGAIQKLKSFQQDVITDMDYLLSEMAEGNFAISSKVGEAAYIGDYQDLLVSFRKTIAKLNNTLSNIELAVDQVNAGSTQVADGAQNLASGTTQQASAIQQLSAAIADLTNQVHENAEHALEGSQISAEAGAAKTTTTLIESTVQAVNNGMLIADKTSKSLDSVVAKTTNVMTKIDDIAKVSEAQDTAIQQINIGIDQIAMVVQTNSATAQQSATASEELSSQADMVKGMVSQFQLKSGQEPTLRSKPSVSAPAPAPVSKPAPKPASAPAPAMPVEEPAEAPRVYGRADKY